MVNAIYGFIGLFGGAFITYLFTIRMNKKQQRTTAGRRFRKAFAVEYSVIDPKSGIKDVSVIPILKDAFPKHMTAKTEFMFYLNESEKSKFIEAWQKYYNETNATDVPWFTPYFLDSGRELFCERIDALFKFTE